MCHGKQQQQSKLIDEDWIYDHWHCHNHKCSILIRSVLLIALDMEWQARSLESCGWSGGGGAISAVIFVFLYKNDKKVKGPARFFAERYVTECIKYWVHHLKERYPDIYILLMNKFNIMIL